MRMTDARQQYRAVHLGLPPGDAGVALTLRAMQAAALGNEGALNPEIRVWALEATRDARDRDDLGQASAIFDAVKRAVSFRGEYSETVQTPLVTLQQRAGDCDDHATLIVSLLRSIGIPARFKTVATDPGDPKTFNHVYALAGLRRGNRIAQWLPMDTTVPHSHAGWEVPRAFRAQLWGGAMDAKLGAYGSEDEEYVAPYVPPLGRGAQDAVGIINQGAQAATNIIASLRNTGNTTTASFNRVPGGFQGNIGTSQTTLIVGGLVAAVAALALLRRG